MPGMARGVTLALGQVLLWVRAGPETRVATYARPRLRLGDHERAHVLQALAFGLLYLPLYLA